MLGGRIGPTHAHVHLLDHGRTANVFGMHVNDDEVMHADRHGAVVIPDEAVRKLPAAFELIARREKVILDVCHPRIHARQAAGGDPPLGRDTPRTLGRDIPRSRQNPKILG